MSTENLFGYTIVNAGYSVGTAGAIRGDRTAFPSTFTPATARVTGLNGDPTIHYFTANNGKPHAVVAEYSFVPVPPPVTVRIYDVSGATWSLVATQTWGDIKNLYGVVVIGNFMYAIDYDNAKIVRVNMTTYAQVTLGIYQFNNTSAPGNYEKYGMAIATDGSHLYGLFNTVDDPNAATPDYYPGTVVKLSVSSPVITEVQRVDVGKSAFTLELFADKLYVASLGGKQQENSYNNDSSLHVVSLGTPMTVSNPFTASSHPPGDFRDITFSSSGDAFILVGYYTSGYATLSGRLYRTTAAAINAGIPSLGSIVDTISSAGFLWATLLDDVTPSTGNRLWFVRGNQIDIYSPPPTTSPSTPTTFAPAALGVSPVNANLNAVTLIGEGTTLAARANTPRSLAAHSRLAIEAMRAAGVLDDTLQD